MSIPELKEFFANNPLPEKFQLSKSVKVLNSKTYLDTCFLRVEDNMSCPDYARLMELYNYAKESMIRKEAF